MYVSVCVRFVVQAVLDVACVLMMLVCAWCVASCVCMHNVVHGVVRGLLHGVLQV